MPNRSLPAVSKDSDEAIRYETESHKYYIAVGKNIRRERDRAGMTNDQLASVLNRSPASCIMWQNASRKPSIFELHRIAQALGVSMADLLMDVEDLDGAHYVIGYREGSKAALGAIQDAVARTTEGNG